jgi:hypothetical protein
MRRLRALLPVRELPPIAEQMRAHLPSLRGLVADLPHPREAEIINYLRRGVVCVLYPDARMRRDVLRPGALIPPPDGDAASLFYRDGAWIWPGVTAYYVAAYHIRLPEEFIRQAEAAGWRIDEGKIALTRADTSACDSPSGEALTPKQAAAMRAGF